MRPRSAQSHFCASSDMETSPKIPPHGRRDDSYPERDHLTAAGSPARKRFVPPPHPCGHDDLRAGERATAGSSVDLYRSMARDYRLPLSVAFVVTGAIILVLSVTLLSPCGGCWPGTWWIPFLRIFGSGVAGSGGGGLIGVYRRRKSLPPWP